MSKEEIKAAVEDVMKVADKYADRKVEDIVNILPDDKYEHSNIGIFCKCNPNFSVVEALKVSDEEYSIITEPTEDSVRIRIIRHRFMNRQARRSI